MMKQPRHGIRTDIILGLAVWIFCIHPLAEATCGRDPRQIVSINQQLALAICSSRVARILRTNTLADKSEERSTASELLQTRESLVIQPGYGQPLVPGSDELLVHFTVTKTEQSIQIRTDEMLIIVDIDHSDNKQSSIRCSFLETATGRMLTREIESEITIHSSESDDVGGVRQSWKILTDDEAWYGGGQLVNGELNYRGAPLQLVQSNTEAVVPFFVSSAGFGILWDNYGITHLNKPPKDREVHLNQLLNAQITKGGAFTTSARAHDAVSLSYESSWTAPESGAYWFYVVLCPATTFFCNYRVNSFELALNTKTVTRTSLTSPLSCQFELANIPSSLACRLDPLEKGKTYHVSLNINGDNSMSPKLFYTSLQQTQSTTLESECANVIDYYFIAAAKAATSSLTSTMIDSLIASYREMTGTAHLYAKKAYGFWQCKEHYHTQDELLQSAKMFRELEIPVDNIVQDWHYWGDLGWGPQWDKKIYPDPADMIKRLHQNYSMNFMVSVWSTFDEATMFYQDLKQWGLLLNGSSYMDAWNPAARARFFQYIKEAHFDIGVDHIWLDATEPEGNPQLGVNTFLGPAALYFNTYSLKVSQAIQEGLNEYDGRRVFSLTRSSFAGQQRYGACLWSGDITGSWDSLRRQISMSTNYQLSGIPYWSMDTGGFDRPPDQYTSEDYQKLLTRWFQFAVFTPIMRVHGCNSDTELWHFGNTTQKLIVNSALSLRYRLLEYIYSGFSRVEREHYTMQRGMIFDFPDDSSVRNLADQFMFGEAFLVAPVIAPDDHRLVYLPPLDHGATWTDFYTGQHVPAGDHSLNVPLDRIPLFVRSSVVLLSPKRQHVLEPLTEERLEVRIYAGRDSMFVWYQDDGKDARWDRPYRITTFTWNQSMHCLTLGARTGPGTVPGLSRLIKLDVVLVAPNHGVGVDPTERPDRSLSYNGTEQVVCLSRGGHGSPHK